jgi:hypothetical protein
MPYFGANRSAVPPLWPFLLSCAGLAVCIDLGTLHAGFYADTLLPVFTSLYRWTFFAWEQDRTGMLPSLLALPFHAPLVNLLVQNAFDVFCGLAAFFLLTRYVLRDGSYPIVAALGAAAFVAFPPIDYRYEFFVNNYHSVWLALGLGGLILAEAPDSGSYGWRRPLFALLLITAAHWVYCTAALYLGPLVVFRCLFGWRRQQAIVSTDSTPATPALRRPGIFRRWWQSELVVSLLLLSLGFLAGMGFREYRLRQVPPPNHIAQFDTLPPDQWWITLKGLVENTHRYLAPSIWPQVLIGLAAAGLLLLVLPAVRRQAALPLRAAVAVLLAAGLVTCFMATRTWVQVNLCFFRYILPCAFFVQAALLTVAVAPLAAALSARARNILSSLTLLLVLAGIYHSYGVPSLQQVRINLGLDPHPLLAGRVPALLSPGRDDIVTEEVLRAHCTHIAGDYWKVFPALFRANQALYERGESRTIWGLTGRCQPTYDLWKSMPPEELCVAVPVGDGPIADYFFKLYGLPPLSVVERYSSVWILRPTAHSLPEPSPVTPQLRAEVQPAQRP